MSKPSQIMDVTIRPLQAAELTTADRIFRLAFGTFIGLPDPMQFSGDADYIQHRWATEPTGAFAAEVNGELIGSNLAINWGSVSFFGPLSVHPTFWNQGIAQQLIAPVIEQFTQWNTTLAGLFTFPASPKHHVLYQKFGFYPRFLTYVMTKPVEAIGSVQPEARYSQLNHAQQLESLKASRELTNKVYDGLDVSHEIETVQTQSLGDTVLLWDEQGLAGLAICHCGAGTEAGSNTCFVKFGTVRPGSGAAQRFERLLELCEAFSANQGMAHLVVGVNMSQEQAYQQLISRRFRIEITGIAMHRHNQPGYYRPELFVLGDWR